MGDWCCVADLSVYNTAAVNECDLKIERGFYNDSCISYSLLHEIVRRRPNFCVSRVDLACKSRRLWTLNQDNFKLRRR